MPPHGRRQQDVCHHFAAQCHWMYTKLFVQNNRVMLVPRPVNETSQEYQCTSFFLFIPEDNITLLYISISVPNSKYYIIPLISKSLSAHGVIYIYNMICKYGVSGRSFRTQLNRIRNPFTLMS